MMIVENYLGELSFQIDQLEKLRNDSFVHKTDSESVSNTSIAKHMKASPIG